MHGTLHPTRPSARSRRDRHRHRGQEAVTGAVAAAGDPQPSLSSLVAQARDLAHQIDVLSEQYDGLRIQLTQAHAEAQTAQTTYRQDLTRLGAGQAAIGQLAAESYMNGGLASPLAGAHLQQRRRR